MPEPKKSPTKRRQGNRRGQISLKLRRQVNKFSPVKVFTTRNETPNLAKKPKSKAAKATPKKASSKVKPATKAAPKTKKPAASAKKPAAKKAAKK